MKNITLYICEHIMKHRKRQQSVHVPVSFTSRFLSKVDAASFDLNSILAALIRSSIGLLCAPARQQAGPGLVSIPDLIRSIRTTQVRAYSIVKHPRAVEDSR